jgi:rSAM/selenodomain-associated transferase 2
MNAGASAASGEVFLFLHADTLLPENWAREVFSELSRPGAAAVAFTLSFSSRSWTLRTIEKLANLRSHLFQMPYGDQAIAVKATLFHELGGFRDLPIMEDWDLICRLRAKGRVRTAASRVMTSSRRWDTLGVLRTSALNQIVILGYVLGVSPSRLARLYDRGVGGDSIPRSDSQISAKP